MMVTFIIEFKNNQRLILKYNFNKKNWLMSKTFILAGMKGLLVTF
jgi:hypothetical protein